MSYIPFLQHSIILTSKLNTAQVNDEEDWSLLWVAHLFLLYIKIAQFTCFTCLADSEKPKKSHMFHLRLRSGLDYSQQ